MKEYDAIVYLIANNTKFPKGRMKKEDGTYATALKTVKAESKERAIEIINKNPEYEFKDWWK